MSNNEYHQTNRLIWPAFIIIILVWVVPFLYQVIISFLDYRISTPESKGEFVGFNNYREALVNDDNFASSIKLTLRFTFTTLIIQLFTGIFLAISLVGLENRIKGIVTIALIVPLVLAPFVVGLMWNFQLNPVFGPFSYFSKEVGLLSQNNSYLSATNAFMTICSIDVWQNTPFMTLIFASALSGIPKSVIESLKINNVSPIKQVFRVYIKYILPIAVIAIFLRLVGLIKTFDTIHILTGGGPSNLTETYGLYSYRLSFRELNFGLGSAEGLIVNYGVLLIVLIILKRIRFYKI